MQKPLFFEFTGYSFEPQKKKARFTYRFVFPDAPDLCFTETLILPRTPKRILPAGLLEEALQALHLAIGTSYYKTYAPSQVKVSYILTKEQALFWNIVYRDGLGEFRYQNNLSFQESPHFPYSTEKKPRLVAIKNKERVLLGVGGGKDSIIAGELLKKAEWEVAGFTTEESSIVDDVAKRMAIPLVRVRRVLDKKLFSPAPDWLNGHIPVSLIYAFVGVFTALIYDYKFIAVGNERTSNAGNCVYEGKEINHQWSKSERCELLVQKYIHDFITPDSVYFSALRQFYEIRVAKLFSEQKKYWKFFSSCNRNFRLQGEKPRGRWCGECSKCVYVFLLFSAFLSRKELVGIFKKNLYADDALRPLFRDVLGFGTIKPFDCVGTFEEARVALVLSCSVWGETFTHKMYLKRVKNVERITRGVFQLYPATTTPPVFASLGKELAILGYGREGRETMRFLKNTARYGGARVTVLDEKQNPDYLSYLNSFDIIFKTPGISSMLPKIQEARKNGTIFSSQTQLFFEHAKGVIIGITGSRGKSTTATLLYQILRSCGKDVHLAGNIGIPMLRILPKLSKSSITILELSSFQLDHLPYSPHIAVILDIYPDHLDWHKTHQAYVDAKARITLRQTKHDKVFYLSGNADTAYVAKKGNGEKIQIVPQQYTLFKQEELRIRGEHMFKNACAAAVVAGYLGCSKTGIRKEVVQFRGLSYRLQLVRTAGRIRFYNDSTSVNPSATLAAVKSFTEPTILIMGGVDRGLSYTGFANGLARTNVRVIILCGENKKKIREALQKSRVPVIEKKSLATAVQEAMRHSKKMRELDGIHNVVFSPGAASFDQFKNYVERGREFNRIVKKLKV